VTTAGQLDETAIAEALVAIGCTLEAAFVRHFKGRRMTTWQELVEAVRPGETRDWGAVRTWVNRVNNALLDLKVTPSLRLIYTREGDRIAVEDLVNPGIIDLFGATGSKGPKPTTGKRSTADRSRRRGSREGAE
jgi:hypothetical protein